MIAAVLFAFVAHTIIGVSIFLSLKRLAAWAKRDTSTWTAVLIFMWPLFISDLVSSLVGQIEMMQRDADRRKP